MSIRTSDHSTIAVCLAAACLCILVAGAAGAQLVAVDFSGLAEGASVEGLGAVHPDLNIRSSSGTAMRMIPGASSLAYRAYGAPSTSCAGVPTILNGCMDPSGGFGNSGGLNNVYTFTFSPGTTINDFSLHMLDFGDYNPGLTARHEVRVNAYDGLDVVVDTQVLAYNSTRQSNPRNSDYGDLMCGAGDACDAQPGEPGNYTWHVQGPGIAKVELIVVVGRDSLVGFDNLSFTIETPQDKIDLLIAFVESLHLSSGLTNALVSKLEAAKASLDRENSIAAVNQINAFIHLAEAQAGKKIDAIDTAAMIDSANAIIEAIEAPDTPSVTCPCIDTDPNFRAVVDGDFTGMYCNLQDDYLEIYISPPTRGVWVDFSPSYSVCYGASTTEISYEEAMTCVALLVEVAEAMGETCIF